MTAKELALMMVNGDLYKPENDAFFIAKKYLALEKLVEDVFEEYNSTGHLSTKTCLKAGFMLSEDPARAT